VGGVITWREELTLGGRSQHWKGGVNTEREELTVNKLSEKLDGSDEGRDAEETGGCGCERRLRLCCCRSPSRRCASCGGSSAACHGGGAR